MRFRECERIATIPGSVTFTNAVSIACNPGLANSFPWLSGHAALFENYKVHSITYRYKNLKGTASAGNVIMSFDYDTLDSAPTTAIQATQSTHYADGAPWRIFQLKVPGTGKVLFTRSSVPSGVDLKTYDMGSLHVATEGCADTSDHGYLEVEYDIEFFNKQSSSLTSLSVGSTSEFYLSADQAVTADTTIAYDATLINDIGVTNTAGSMLLPAGKYLYFLYFVQSGLVFSSASLHQDGSQFTPPEKINGYTQLGNHATTGGVIELATETAISVSLDWVSGSGSLLQHANRIIFQRL